MMELMITCTGAWQETIQDLSTIIRLGLTPILFVINNKGYTVERKPELLTSVCGADL